MFFEWSRKFLKKLPINPTNARAQLIDIRQKLGTQRFSEFHSFRWHKLLRGGCKCYFSRFQSAIFQVFSHTQMSIFQVLNVVFPTKSAIFQVPAIQLVLLYFIITTTTIKEFGKYLRVASNSNSNVSEAECRDFGSKSGAKSATRRRRRHIDCAPGIISYQLYLPQLIISKNIINTWSRLFIMF